MDAASKVRSWSAVSAWSSCSSRLSTSRWPPRDQVVSIWAGTNGKMDEAPVVDIRSLRA
ncbi:hypothetical protein [Streptomyces sp. KL116D]|uniref:hypothetical protein n=1 Tax=Streptomyces sp. KL116D TaxID=3045152 RepID=UPI0035576812